MALTIKMLKDENKKDFIPFTNTYSVVDSKGEKLQNILDTKVDSKNIKEGNAIQIDRVDNELIINWVASEVDLGDLKNDSGFITEIPVASETKLGAIKVGEGLDIAEDGVLSISKEGIQVTELDPIFTQSAAFNITQNDIDNWNAKPDNPGITSESDPIFTTSPAYNITQHDIDIWNSKPSKEEVSGAVGEAITSAGYLTEESDPLFEASPAAKITDYDIANWNSKPDRTGITQETDPIFTASPAYAITEENINAWNDKVDEETDPIFIASPAYEITKEDITKWKKLDVDYDHSYFFYTNNGSGGIYNLTRDMLETNISSSFGSSGGTRINRGRFNYESIDTALTSFLYPETNMPRLKLTIRFSSNDYARIYPRFYYYDNNGNKVEYESYSFDTNLGLPSRVGTCLTTTSLEPYYTEFGYWHEQVFFINTKNAFAGKKLYLDSTFGIEMLMKDSGGMVHDLLITWEAV